LCVKDLSLKTRNRKIVTQAGAYTQNTFRDWMQTPRHTMPQTIVYTYYNTIYNEDKSVKKFRPLMDSYIKPLTHQLPQRLYSYCKKINLHIVY